MPTPFFHLSIARDLLHTPALPEAAQVFLQTEPGAFLFGNTAPDVQVVSGQRRAATHFFELPILPAAAQPWERLLEQNPVLAHPERLSASQAAFITGYLCHLRADWEWVREIFFPVFGPYSAWGTFHRRLYLHNVLRSYLDMRLLPDLRDGMEARLGVVEPAGWLPFVADRHLKAWRDLLAPQFHPGAAAQTVEVFAARQGIPSAEFYTLLESEDRMQAEIFSHLPYQQIESFRQRLLAESARLVEGYLAAAVRSSRPALAVQVGRATLPLRREKESRP